MISIIQPQALIGCFLHSDCCLCASVINGTSFSEVSVMNGMNHLIKTHPTYTIFYQG